MKGQSSAGARLRGLLDHADGPVLVPGCGDAISARLIEEAGFAATCISGGWTSGARGFLDVGLITLVEMAGNASYIAQAVNIPVLADADTGFGVDVNVARCVQEFERTGVASIQIEDQGTPKRCGLMGDKIVVSVDEMASKVATAVGARQDDEFVIIARTDSLASEGVERAIDRGLAYFEAGADMLMVEALQAEDEVAAVATAFAGQHLVFNRTPQSFAPIVPLDRLGGYSLIYFPMHLVLASLSLQRDMLAEIMQTGMCNSFENGMASVGDFFDLFGTERAAEPAARRGD